MPTSTGTSNKYIRCTIRTRHKDVIDDSIWDSFHDDDDNETIAENNDTEYEQEVKSRQDEQQQNYHHRSLVSNSSSRSQMYPLQRQQPGNRRQISQRLLEKKNVAPITGRRSGFTLIKM